MNRHEFKTKLALTVANYGNKYWEYFGCNSMDWCCAYVAYQMRETAKINHFPKLSSCSALKSALQPWVNHDYKTAEIGDLILFELHNPNDGPDHIGIVVENDVAKKRITLIEGNTGSTDCRTSSVNTYHYAYENSKFDCIIDMSQYFEDFDIQEDKYKVAIEKIKKVLEELV